MNWQDLIAASRVLLTATLPNNQPTQDALRRAISTAYYAMFHALAGSNADCLVGTPHDPITNQAWNRVYRGLDHRTAANQLRQDQSLFSPETRQFAETFRHLQNVRHLADYDPSKTFTPEEADTWIDQAEAAIQGFMQTSIDERKMVAIQVLIRGRNN